MGLHAVLEVVGQLVEVLPVLRREDHGRDVRAPRGDDLLLDAADGQDLAREGDLARHREVLARGDPRRERQQRRRERHARRRPVLGRRAVGEVDVQVRAVERGARVFAEEAAADVVERDAAALLHDAAELARRREPRRRQRLALLGAQPPQLRRLDVERRAAHGRPRQARDDARRRVRGTVVEPVLGEPRRPDEVVEVRLVDDVAAARVALGPRRLRRRVAVADDAQRQFPRDLLHQLLQVPHARLARVALGQRLQRRVREARPVLDLQVAVEARLLERPGHQVVARDRELVPQVVAREPHDLHAVQERAGDRRLVVRRAHEEAAAQVHGHVEVVVEERRVLRRIQELQQRRRRVAAAGAAPAPELVDLVDQDHGVHGPRLLEALDGLAGHRADVRPPVALDLRDVA